MAIKVTKKETYIIEVTPAEYCAYHADGRSLYDKLDALIPDKCVTSIDDIYPDNWDSQFQLNKYIEDTV